MPQLGAESPAIVIHLLSFLIALELIFWRPCCSTISGGWGKLVCLDYFACRSFEEIEYFGLREREALLSLTLPTEKVSEALVRQMTQE